MRKAVQFGAGNIGRGFLGQLFYESDFATTFIDVAEPLIAELNERGRYPLRILDETCSTEWIENVSAVHSTNREAVVKALVECDLAATAVGVNVLSKIAPVLAEGIERRFKYTDAAPLNIIVCENLLDAGPYLREEVRSHLPPALHAALDDSVGFVEASIGRMAPVMTEKQKQEDALLVCTEAYAELPVDRSGFKGPIPYLNHMQPCGNFGAYVERKLFVHNAGHAATAYLGYLRGHEFIAHAIGDTLVRTPVDAAMTESCAGLVSKHGMDADDLRMHKDDLLRRFANPLLNDQIDRVARDPIRKLGNRDRLVGAGLMCLSQGVSPEHLAFAAAAAIRYDHSADPAAQLIQTQLEREGLQRVLQEICGLPEDSPLNGLITAGLEGLSREGWARENA
ncbi:MAG: mannitol-1-phosphate 5-dehydrogenase [Candidatus Hydrogenedentes bacterium]|nr:mannitol-1-phosphate 5-dehydrogenase [Candidatus Hydrogenedentota bacterium]